MIAELKSQTEAQMEKAIEALRKEYARIRTGRASTGILDHILVDYYGTATRLNQMATLSVPESRTIVIQPWDASALKSIEKAILSSDMGLTPSNDGKVIRITIPELTEERRREIVKVIRNMAEDCRVAVRHARKEANDKLKKMEKEKEITEDALHKILDEIQKLTDRFVKKADQVLQTKEEDVMTV
ncbi:MAG: ribosome recycling factor [Deltaproteobacteria bacterium]|nr:ribosome recycling factor [Deltaproteobacteria bacterium]